MQLAKLDSVIHEPHRKRMNYSNIQKVLGCSSTEVDRELHDFFLEIIHNQNPSRYLKRRIIYLAGYEPLITSTIDKLGISFGLLTIALGTSTRIFNNLRVREDCLSSIKVERQMITVQTKLALALLSICP
ncbi:TPR superfamily protein, putative [Medicago truncatula]|uniref:TPR superfamily protein, putative n=1 Tax=Medicago truncatula TaxID=3880 RepID=G7JLR9_MEDTR|nr:TPR superfamily protein, putative [Medicago truncatula]